MKDQITMTAADLKALGHSKIVTAYGISGQETTMDVAMQAPSIIEVRASNGKAYDLKHDGDEWVLIER